MTTVITLHNYDCKMSFGRKDPSCPRCVELLNGAQARAGWQKDYYDKKKREEEQQRLAIKHHFQTCAICTGKERGVCTAFEW